MTRILRTSRRSQTMLAILLLAGVLIWNAPGATQSPQPLNPRDMAMTIPGDFTLASVGDLMMRRPASQSADTGVQEPPLASTLRTSLRSTVSRRRKVDSIIGLLPSW